MNIMLFGGSFDPPHTGHITVAQHVLTQHFADELWFVPCASHPFNKSISSPQHRLAMLHTIHIPNTRIETYELDNEGKSYSLNTLIQLSIRYPQHTFSWIIGSDQLKNFHKWYNYEELSQRFTLYVYPREGYPLEPLYNHMIPLTTLPTIPISSTDIREEISHGKYNEQNVPKEILEYIRKHQLYNA